MYIYMYIVVDNRFRKRLKISYIASVANIYLSLLCDIKHLLHN